MNGRQITENNSPDDILRPKPVAIGRLPLPTAGFMHPDEVVGDLRLTQAEKREILASWASDVRAIPDAPTLRQLDNGAVVRVDDVMRALRRIDDCDDFDRTIFGLFRPLTHRRRRFPTRLKSVLRRSWSDDDDDPPPCPATIVGPLGGPLAGGETADRPLALAT